MKLKVFDIDMLSVYWGKIANSYLESGTILKLTSRLHFVSS